MPTAMRPGKARQAAAPARVLRRGAAQDDPAHAGGEPGLDAGHVADAAAELHRDLHRREDGGDRGGVHRPAGEGAVQVHHVQPGEAGILPRPRLRCGIVGIHGRLIHGAAPQPHALAVLQVDGGVEGQGHVQVRLCHDLHRRGAKRRAWARPGKLSCAADLRASPRPLAGECRQSRRATPPRAQPLVVVESPHDLAAHQRVFRVHAPPYVAERFVKPDRRLLRFAHVQVQDVVAQAPARVPPRPASASAPGRARGHRARCRSA